jgi:hypothetical protein
MNRETTLNDILQVEDSIDISQICCPDTSIPLWSTIRCSFLRLIMGDLLYSVPINGGSTLGSSSKLRKISTISRAFAHNALRLHTNNQPFPIVLMATGARLRERDGRYFNTLSDYFVAAAPDRTFAIEDLFDSKWPFPRHHHDVLLHTPLRVEGVLKGRLRVANFREPARALVDLLSQRAKDKMGWDIGQDRRQWLENFCVNGSASLLPRYQKYHSIFKKIEARVLIKEEACYGGADNATAMLAAKHLEMVTAEYQHGAISSGHDAYNFAPTLLNAPAFKQILPDHFLTYGSWWGEQINAPVNKISIGNPHRGETIDLSRSTLTHGRQILILGDGIDTSVYLELCKCLAAALGGMVSVLFRPHPLERARVYAKYPDGFIGKIRIDSHSDIYNSFREAEAVVSEVSTGLFEAIGLVPKVFIWDTPKARFSFPVHPFQGFSDANELARLILDESAGRVSSRRMESIWAPNWKRNYTNFLEKVTTK